MGSKLVKLMDAGMDPEVWMSGHLVTAFGSVGQALTGGWYYWRWQEIVSSKSGGK